MTRGFYGHRGYRHGGFRHGGFGRGFGFGGFGGPFIGGLAGGLLGSALFDGFEEAIHRTMVIHMPRIRTTVIRHMDIIDRFINLKKRMETIYRYPCVF